MRVFEKGLTAATALPEKFDPQGRALRGKKLDI